MLANKMLIIFTRNGDKTTILLLGLGLWRSCSLSHVSWGEIHVKPWTVQQFNANIFPWKND